MQNHPVNLWEAIWRLVTAEEREALAQRNLKGTKSYSSQAHYIKRRTKNKAVKRLANLIIQHPHSGDYCPSPSTI